MRTDVDPKAPGAGLDLANQAAGEGPAKDEHQHTPGRGRLGLATGLSIACWVAVAAQLIGLLLWSWYELDRASLTWDFGIYYQPWYLIAHGHLLPRNTFQGGFPFWKNDGELIVYVLAPLYWLFPNHMLGYLWLQDLAIVGVTAVCLRWVIETFPLRRRGSRAERAIALSARGLVVLLLVANPWVYWTASFDIHMEVFGAFFALLTMRAVLRRERISLVFALLTLLCGAASALYLLGVGLAGLVTLAWRERDALARARSAGARAAATAVLAALASPLGLALGAVVWLSALGALGATTGSPSAGYDYLLGSSSRSARPGMVQVALAVLAHPMTALHVLGTHGWNLWANTSPDGFLGLFTPVGFFLSVPTLLANNLLKIQQFSYPSFQNFVVYGFVAFGSVSVVVLLLKRRRAWPLGVVVMLAMVGNAIGWSAVWVSTTASQWVQISPSAAAIVKEVSHEATASQEVVSSQAFVGLFAGRQDIYSFSGPLEVPVKSATIWFVLSPDVGIETASQAQTLEAINTVAELPGVKVLSWGKQGIFVFRWHPHKLAGTVGLGEAGDHYPVWVAAYDAGKAVLRGPTASWHVESTGATGYLFDYDYFQLPPGHYVAEVRYQSNIAVTPEVWNEDGKLLAGTVRAAPRPTTVSVPFTIAPGGTGEPPHGVGIFQDAPIPYTTVPAVDVSIWTPAGGHEEVWWAAIRPSAKH